MYKLWYYRNIHKKIKYCNAYFDSDGSLETDVREVPSLKKEEIIWQAHIFLPRRCKMLLDPCSLEIFFQLYVS